MKIPFRAALAFLLLLWSVDSFAHKQSDSYLNITASHDSATLQGQWDIALRDLEFVIGLDANADDKISWGEVKSRREAIARYAFDHLGIESIGGGDRQACPAQMRDLLIDEHVDGAYAVLRFTAACPVAAQKLIVHYSLLSGVDPNHRGLLDLRADGFNQTVVLSQETPTLTLDMHAANPWQQFSSFVTEGVWHIWKGYDHILFLFTLLLPAVVLYRDRQWQARPGLRDAVFDILKVVSAFTLAHSITLSLAALGVVNVPSRWVESAIALTVLLGALNIIFPVIRERRWAVAFCFGLIHGLGFAAVLADLGLATGGLLRALIGFNVGVEIGQLAIVLALMPLIHAVRGSMFYRRIALPAGATLICVLAAYWIASRAFPDMALPSVG